MARKSDGEIVISTKLDNSELDKDLEKLDKKIEKKGKKKKKIPVEVEVTENSNNDKVIENVEKKIKKKATTSKKKTSGTKQKTVRPQFDPEDTSGITFSFGGQTFDQKGADEYLKKVEQINEETTKSNEQKIEIPEKTIKQAKEVKKEIQEAKQNIEELPTTKIEEVAQKEKQVAGQVEKVNENLQEVKKDDYIQLPVDLKMDKFDKQIQKLNEKIQKKEKEKIKLETDIKNIKESEAGYDELIKKSHEYGDKLIQAKQKVEELTNARKELTNGGLEHKDLPQYQEYGVQIKEAEAKVTGLNTQIANTDKEISKWDNKLTNNANKIEAIKAKQVEVTEEVKKYKNQIESVKLQKQQSQVDQLKDGFNKMSTSVSSSIKHIGRLALGVFSVASAYRLMSAASGTLGQYDEQYATNLEYIRYLIAQAIAPALKYVVNLASTLLSYLNYIAQAWFKVTLFSKNSSKNFMKARESTSKIKKDLQTTPFDE